METLSLVAMGLTIITGSRMLWILAKHCSAGFLGEPDIWDNPLWEKRYYKVACLTIILLIITNILYIIS